jgi:flagellar FliL protein
MGWRPWLQAMGPAMAASGETAAEAPPKKGRAKLLLLGGVGLVVVLGGGGAAAWYTGLFGGATASEQSREHEAPEDDGHNTTGADGEGEATVAFVDMPDLIVNLQSDSARLRYLKLRLALEVAGEPAAEAVRQLMPRVMDSFQLYLRALTLDDVQGAVGMQRLKEELTARVNLAVEPARVSSVLLKEMLVQ